MFFAAPSVDAACRIGGEVCQGGAQTRCCRRARGAIGHGVVTPREGDYFGPLVNLVSRLVKAAGAVTLVVTAEAAVALSDDGEWTTSEFASQSLRGVENPGLSVVGGRIEHVGIHHVGRRPAA